MKQQPDKGNHLSIHLRADSALTVLALTEMDRLDMRPGEFMKMVLRDRYGLAATKGNAASEQK
jgi:hypothetical protein